MLPHDPLNNPLIEASFPYRLAGALRVYARGLLQVIFPGTLSGDLLGAPGAHPRRASCSRRASSARSRCSARCWPAPSSGGPRGSDRARKASPRAASTLSPLVALGLVWAVISYFPVSNIPVVLPTVRAERFWYFPAVGLALPLGMAWAALLRTARRVGALSAGVGLCVLYFAFQAVAARRHALDYTNDLTFWNATRKAVPRSAKAHLNYSVMLGARGDLAGRLASNEVALELAPQWPMANVYLGDTLCRGCTAPPRLFRTSSPGSVSDRTT